MSNKTIKCPNCGAEIESTEVLTSQIEESIKAKYVADTAIGNVTDIYGTIEGLIGSKKLLTGIEPLSLDSINNEGVVRY